MTTLTNIAFAPNLFMDVYQGGPTPIIYLHPGGFRDKSQRTDRTDVEFCTRLAQAAKATVFAIDYPTDEPLPAPVEAVRAAEAHIWAHSRDYPMMASLVRSTLVGVSAGSILAQMTCAQAPDRFRGVIAISGCLLTSGISFLAKRDQKSFMDLLGVRKLNSPEAQRKLFDYMPENHLTQFPRTLIVQGMKDERIKPDNATKFHAMLMANHRDSTIITDPDEGHGIGVGTKHLAQIAAWVNQ